MPHKHVHLHVQESTLQSPLEGDAKTLLMAPKKTDAVFAMVLPRLFTHTQHGGAMNRGCRFISRDKARPDLEACARAAAAQQQELDELLESATSALTSLADEAQHLEEAHKLVDRRLARCQDQCVADAVLRLEARVRSMSPCLPMLFECEICCWRSGLEGHGHRSDRQRP